MAVKKNGGDIKSIDDVSMLLLHCKLCKNTEFFVNYNKKHEMLVIVCTSKKCLEPYPIVDYNEGKRKIILPRGGLS